jgi:glycosyltransferase involved in cell wall biosynthesis
MTGESSGRQGHREKIVVVSPSRSIGMSHYAQGLAASLSHHADVVLLDRAAAATGILAMAFDLRRAVREDGAAVIATSPHWSLPFVLLWVRARGGHVMHGPLIYMASRVTRPFYVAYYRALTRRLRVVILHAERFVDGVRALKLRPDRIVVVPHGFVPDGLVRSGEYDPDGPFICIGRLLPYKGVDVFVRALEILMQRGESVTAVIGGEGVTDEVAPDGLGGLEILPGRISDASFAALVDRCAAVVLPYRNATQSGVLAHAFVAGRPVIATNVGSFPDYVDDDNGFLVPPGDAEALAEAISALHKDPTSSRQLAAGARRTWEERLDPDAAARRILDALEV